MLTKPFQTEPPPAARLRPNHTLTDRLIGCWLFNEGAGFRLHDLSGHSHQGNLSGDPQWQSSRYGHALVFDGNNDWVSMGNCLDMRTDDLTVLAIVSFSADQPEQWSGFHFGGIAGKGYLGGTNRGYGLFVADNRIAWQVRDLTQYREVKSDSLLNDGRYHVAVGVCDRDSATGLRLYVDGIRQAQIGDPTPFSGTDLSGSQSFAVGTRHDESGTWNWDLLGGVAAVCLWRRVLTDGEIVELYRDPWAFVARGRSLLNACAQGIVTVQLAGSIHCTSSITARLTVQKEPSPHTKTPWQQDALFNGMTSRAFQLGTALTQGWFWMRRNGCQVVYRGPSLDEIDFTMILHVIDIAAPQFSLPAWVSHAPGASYCYLVQRFNGAGWREQTTGAAAAVRFGLDGLPADPTPKPVSALEARQSDSTALRLAWSYDPLDQDTAPDRFNVYWDGGTGLIDLQNPVAVLDYKGRRFYCHECEVDAGGDYTFIVRTQSTTGEESMSSQRAQCQVRSVPPPSPSLIVADPI